MHQELLPSLLCGDEFEIQILPKSHTINRKKGNLKGKNNERKPLSVLMEKKGMLVTNLSDL